MKLVSVIALVVAMVAALATGLGRASAPSRIVFTADRAPSLSGEIYRLDPSGHRVDLAPSPFEDSGPVVSPDGRRVAFVSDRSGALSVWEVGIDGRGLVQVGPSLVVPVGLSWYAYDLAEQYSLLAWQPHGNRLAFIADSYELFILRAGQEPLPVASSSSYLESPVWSPDGKVLVADDGGVLRAFSPTGRQLWRIADAGRWSWSRHGLLAVSIAPSNNGRSGFRVYDERGRLRFAIHGAYPGTPGWSPNGELAAAALGDRLVVVTATGRQILRTRIGGSLSCRDVVWASGRRVVVGAFLAPSSTPSSTCHVVGVDVRTGERSRASSLWFLTRSPDGKLAALATQHGSRVAIGVARTADGARTTYAHFPACGVLSLQFAGRSRSLVYASSCTGPTNLYSVAPDGNGLQQITRSTDAAQSVAVGSGLSLSPDGTRIAYAHGAIWLIPSSGGTPVALTTPPSCQGQVPPPYRPPASSPSWSPDGTTILFTQTECDQPDDLYTVPASGGLPHHLGLNGDQPTWGPSQIAYVSGGIWTANPDGTNPIQISTNGTDPAWSADGRLAYLTGTNNTTVVVGPTQTQLPFTAVTSLAWSPDATRFLVSARTTQTGPYDLYTLNTDGTDPVQLTHNYDTIALSWR